MAKKLFSLLTTRNTFQFFIPKTWIFKIFAHFCQSLNYLQVIAIICAAGAYKSFPSASEKPSVETPE